MTSDGKLDIGDQLRFSEMILMPQKRESAKNLILSRVGIRHVLREFFSEPLH